MESRQGNGSTEDATGRATSVAVDALLLSPIEAARRLGIGRSTLYELLGSGEVESLHIGRRRLIASVALVEFVERRRLDVDVGTQTSAASARVEVSPQPAPPRRRSRQRPPSQPQLPLVGSQMAAGNDADEEAGTWRP